MPPRERTVTAFRDEDLIDLFSRLPDLLDRRPDLEPTIYGAFLKTFVRREELALVLNELRTLRNEMNQRFEQVDQRFEQMDERFEQVDQRFEQMDERFEQVDQRFEQVDRRFDNFRTEVTTRFEQVDRRIDDFRTEVATRFEQVDQRIDDFQTDVASRFDDVQRSIDRLGARWGIRNESLFRQTMAALLEQSFGVRVEQRTIAGEQFDILIYDGQHVLVEIAASVGPTIQTRLERKRRLYEESTGVRPTRVILATASIHSRRAHQLRTSGIEVIEPEETSEEIPQAVT